ncbi:MAG: MgtC/SapB family protein [Candidatus Hydrogenedentes bacterium]|nr:MgtC/SapB family protein [Candidatus Hydrogenedentota bacterium]
MNSTSLLDAAGGLLNVAPLSWSAIFACIASGAIIGCERQIQGKPMGARTSILICLGTYALVTAGLGITNEVSDPTRVVGQIITGIGFLGAGVMMTRDGAVVGVTSAASIWMLAAIGIIIATSAPVLGIKLAVLSVIILVGLNYTETALRGLGGLAHRVLHPHMRESEEVEHTLPPGGERRRPARKPAEHE